LGFVSDVIGTRVVEPSWFNWSRRVSRRGWKGTKTTRHGGLSMDGPFLSRKLITTHSVYDEFRFIQCSAVRFSYQCTNGPLPKPSCLGSPCRNKSMAHGCATSLSHGDQLLRTRRMNSHTTIKILLRGAHLDSHAESLHHLVDAPT